MHAASRFRTVTRPTYIDSFFSGRFSVMKLHDLELSGNCYKVRLLCALLDVPITLVPVDFLGGEHKGERFTKLNPFQELPVLEDEGLVLRDSQAILVYIARKYGTERWLPTSAAELAHVMEWLSTAANDVARGPNDARLHDLFGYSLDIDVARKKAHRVLGVLEIHLTSREWLAVAWPTIADIACFPYVALAPQGGVPLTDYPAVHRWLKRIKALPNFIPMPGIAL
jgi:glutathione S-transferase